VSQLRGVPGCNVGGCEEKRVEPKKKKDSSRPNGRSAETHFLRNVEKSPRERAVMATEGAYAARHRIQANDATSRGAPRIEAAHNTGKSK